MKTENYKDQFKIIDTEVKAYFLGLAFGDGSTSYSKGYKFTMGSINTDLEIYKAVHKAFPFFKLCTYPSHQNMIYLDCYEKEFVTDILKLGLTQNKKEQDLKHNFNFPKLDENLVHHFVRGFFDADGSVYRPSRYRSRNNTRVEFGLGTQNFCLQLQKVLLKNNLDFKYYQRFKTTGFDKKLYESFTLLCSRRASSNKFADYIYKDATVYLERKKSIFDIYIKSEKQLLSDILPSCPYCGATKVWSIGVRKGKRRLLCQICNKGYSVIMPLNLEIG